MVVHVLRHGHTLCGMPGLPKDWPADHNWVSDYDRKAADCPECLRTIQAEEDDTSPIY